MNIGKLSTDFNLSVVNLRFRPFLTPRSSSIKNSNNAEFEQRLQEYERMKTELENRIR